MFCCIMPPGCANNSNNEEMCSCVFCSFRMHTHFNTSSCHVMLMHLSACYIFALSKKKTYLIKKSLCLVTFEYKMSGMITHVHCDCSMQSFSLSCLEWLPLWANFFWERLQLYFSSFVFLPFLLEKTVKRQSWVDATDKWRKREMHQTIIWCCCWTSFSVSMNVY